MNLNNKLIWTITDGSEGMISQVMGLAQQMSSNILQIKTNLIFPWSKFQPGILPIFKWIFKNDLNLDYKPDIIISCGRKSVYTSLYIKKIFKKKIISIHIQNPKINTSYFDYVIAPEHDKLDTNNVLKSNGAIHKFTDEIIKKCKDDIDIKEKNNLVSIIIGGPNQHYKFSIKLLTELIDRIKILKKKYKQFTFCVVPSRRTKEIYVNFLKKELDGIAYVWNKKTNNPYLYCLKYSSFFIVTSDSSSMISECAFTGKPVYVYHLPFKRISNRISYFHKTFENQNITRKLSDSLDVWTYTKLNEAERIAGILRSRILE